MAGIPFIVSAPSGAGKTTLCKMAVDFFPDLRHSVSYTTRPARSGETDGVEYRFVDDAEFDRMVEAGEFLEHAVVHGRRYGTARAVLTGVADVDIIFEVDVQGAENIRETLSGGVYIFIIPPSIEECRSRLRGRGKDPEEEIERRLKIALEEISRAPKYDYIIINDELDEAFERLKCVIKAERSRSPRMMEKVIHLFGAPGRD